MKHVPLLVAAFFVLLMTAPAAAQGPLDGSLQCFQEYESGDTQSSLSIAIAPGSAPVDYEIARNYVPATGAFQSVAVLTGSLSTTVTLDQHWVRSLDDGGPSGWVSCESYERISFIDAAVPQDLLRPTANIALGLDATGSSPTGSDNGNAYRVFEGDDDDVIVTDASNAPVLAPNGGKFAWTVRFRLPQSSVEFLEDAGDNGSPNVSWNIMQRGLFGDAGGQWKMSLVTSTNSDRFRVECISGVQAGTDDNIRATSSVDLSTLPIANGLTPWITATCIMDDTGDANGAGTGDGLQVVVDGVVDPEELNTDFGVSLPLDTARCRNIPLDPVMFPGGIGNVVTVGNKPACSIPNTNDDAFIGHVDYAKVAVLSPFQTVHACGGINGDASDFAAAGFNLTVGTSGNDSLDLSGETTPQAIIGLGGNDTIDGGSSDDLICGGDGDDDINGGSGGDTILGQDGNDTISGGLGGDLISGNAGVDVLHGEGGADTIFGGSGNDTITGGDGNDTLGGSSGFDQISGEDGDDVISGGSDSDGLISGGLGNDAVNGGGGDDNNVRGDGGDDTVSGNSGNDRIFGSTGNDIVRGGSGDDIVNGNDGDDFVAGNGGTDTCDGGTNAEVAGDTAAPNCETVVNVP